MHTRPSCGELGGVAGVDGWFEGGTADRYVGAAWMFGRQPGAGDARDGRLREGLVVSQAGQDSSYIVHPG